MPLSFSDAEFAAVQAAAAPIQTHVEKMQICIFGVPFEYSCGERPCTRL